MLGAVLAALSAASFGLNNAMTRRGVLADGLSTTISGLAGGTGTNTSTPAVGLSQATGVTSRVVALAVGAIFILLGVFPKLTALLAVMPRAVMLPALLFTITFIVNVTADLVVRGLKKR